MIDPPSTDQLTRIALQHLRLGHFGEAQSLYREVLKREPDNAEAVHYMGLIAYRLGRPEVAMPLIQRSTEIQPQNPAYRVNLANMLQESRHYAEAIEQCRRAIEIQPEFAPGHAALGAVFCSSGEPQDAVAPLRHALGLQPNDLTARYILAESLSRLGDFAEAAVQYEAVLAVDPNHAKAHFGRGMLRLLLGDFARGWDDYERRWRTGDPSIPNRQFTAPLWDGSDLSGKTILLYCEQGHGDAIQFVRYAPLAADRGAKVILESLPALTRLFRSVAGVESLIELGQPLPPHDFRCPLMTLPKVFNTRLETIPASVPYLSAPRELIETRLSKIRARDLKIGLAWSGNPLQPMNRDRAIPPETLAPLAQVAGVQFYNLQRFEPEFRHLLSSPPGLDLVDLTDELSDFADTAALIQNLDLVMTVDTGVAHLAGALGKPVWLMAMFVPDWRWLLDRIDSPWYPSMRIFRQEERRKWGPVVGEVVRELGKMAASLEDRPSPKKEFR